METRPFPPSHGSEKRSKVLLRSTGSFSIIEDNIIVPTPRKLSSVPSSPVRNRRDKRWKRKSKDESLFGEAGQEIQTILFQSLEGPSPRAQRIVELRHSSESEEEEEVIVPPPRVSVNLASPVPSPPIRASNPMIANTPFHRMNEESPNTPHKTGTVNHFAVKLAAKALAKRKELFQATIPKSKSCRFRSASWPALATIEPKPRRLVF